MAVTGWKYPTAAVGSLADDDSALLPWANPTNIFADDAAIANRTSSPSTHTRTLRGSGFGFTSADIPDGATITGIELAIRKYGNSAGDYLVSLVPQSTGSASDRAGSNKAMVGVRWPEFLGDDVLYGGAGDMWGTTISLAQIKSSDFAVDLQGTAIDFSAGMGVDSFKVRIYYQPLPAEYSAAITEENDALTASARMPARSAAADIAEANDTLYSRIGLTAVLDLDFLASEVPDPRITWAGGVNGTRTNSAGVIVAASAPRYNYDPVTLLRRGVLLEDPRTNLLLNSLLNGTSLSTQSVTVAAVPYTLSFYGTGSIALSGAYTGTLNGTGAYPARTVLTFTPTAGTLTLTVTGSVQFANLEAGSWATSFIPTGASAVTRTAETPAMTDLNFSSWFNPVEGTFVVEYDVISLTSTSWIVAAHSGSAVGTNDYIGLVKGSGNQNRQAITAAGVSQGTIDLAGSIINTPMKLAGAYKANDAAASVNGGNPGTDPTVTLPTPNALSIGYLFSQSLNGHIRRIRYYDSRMANADLRLYTTPPWSAAIIEGGDVAASTAAVLIKGAAAIAEAGDLASAIATARIKATATPVEGGDVLSAVTTVRIRAALARVEAGDSVASALLAITRAALALDEAGDVLAATMHAGPPAITPPERTIDLTGSLATERTLVLIGAQLADRTITI